MPRDRPRQRGQWGKRKRIGRAKWEKIGDEFFRDLLSLRFLGRTNRRRLSLSLSVGNRLLRGLCILGFSFSLFFSSFSHSLLLFLTFFLACVSLSLSLASEISVARRDFFFSHLSLFRKLFPSFSFNFKGFMVLSVVDTNMEKVQDRWPNQEILTRNTYPRSQLDECCREK